MSGSAPSGFRDRTVVVTGASRGIGAAVARRVAADGGRVVLGARGTEALSELAGELRADGAGAVAVRCDVADRQDVDRLVQAAVDHFGGLDVLVNNAGTIEPIAHLADSDPEAWSHALDVNLKGAYFAMRAALRAMDGRGGVIVNLSSGAATRPMEGWSHYCAAKAGVLALTRCGHLEAGASGVRVVGLSPGTVATRMQAEIRASGMNPVSALDPEAHIPPEWVAQAVAFLCGQGGEAFAGEDFSLKTDEGRALVGLPPVGG